MPFKNPEDKKKYQREWRKKNPEKVKSWSVKKYLRTNPNKKWTHSKTIEEKKFRIKNSKKKVLNNAREFVWNYKSTHPCETCGESHPAALDFHHINPSEKRKDIPRLAKYGINAVKEEISKCKVLCANCHVKLHKSQIKQSTPTPYSDYSRFPYKLEKTLRSMELSEEDIIEIKTKRKKIYQRNANKRQKEKTKLFIQEYKLNHPCSICNEKDHMCLEFHHKNESDKKYNISSLYKMGMKKVKEEIEKCETVCANCHRKIHNKKLFSVSVQTPLP